MARVCGGYPVDCAEGAAWIGEIGLRGILLIDFATFAFSTITLLIIPIPLHRRVAGSDDDGPRTMLQDIRFGWQYIAQHPGLLGLLGYFAILNFFEEFMYPLAQPLLFETTTPAGAGSAMSIMGVGMLVGIGVMGIWGGPKRRVQGILIPGIFSGLVIALAGLRPSITLITAAGFGYFALLPIIQGSDRALWQTKVAEDVQGRVFAMQTMITSSIGPLALLLAGPLADHIFEPAMQEGGLLADSVGQVIGVGAGRGLALFIMILGLLSALVSALAYANPRIRLVEDELPDADVTHVVGRADRFDGAEIAVGTPW
jgi:DHA3 family macrolide efflux protein-like MFS transporter